MKKMFFVILMSLVTNVLADSDMEGFVIGGENADIRNYPHSAFLYIDCRKDDGDRTSSACGSSIVNQLILLSAAHCFDSCTKSTIVTVFAGDVRREQGMSRTGKQFVMHKKYNPRAISHDVALLKLTQKLNLGQNVKRVVLMKEPPYQEQAAVAGWGLVDDVKKKAALLLKHIAQVPVHSREKCNNILKKLPEGCICAGQEKGKNYISRGDSGSALIVHHFIQIGVVSFKYPTISKSVAVYTDVGYYYKWITEHAEKLYCNELK